MVGVKRMATEGRVADMNSAKSRLRISAGWKMSLVTTGSRRLSRSTSRSQPLFMLRNAAVGQRQIEFGNYR